MRLLLILIFLCKTVSIGYCDEAEVGESGKKAASLIEKAYAALEHITTEEIAIRTSDDLKEFKKTIQKFEKTMRECLEESSKIKQLSDFEIREIQGIASRYQYQLFPPNIDGKKRLEKVPEEIREKLIAINSSPRPKINEAWRAIHKLLEMGERDSFSIPIGSLKIDNHLEADVYIGRNKERPGLQFTPDSLSLTAI